MAELEVGKSDDRAKRGWEGVEDGSVCVEVDVEV